MGQGQKGNVSSSAARWRMALIFSLCILPGAGHWYLRQRLRASFYAVITLSAILYPLVRISSAISIAMENLLLQDDPSFLRMGTVLSAVVEGESMTLVLGLLALVLCWVAAAADLIVRRPSLES